MSIQQQQQNVQKDEICETLVVNTHTNLGSGSGSLVKRNTAPCCWRVEQFADD